MDGREEGARVVELLRQRVRDALGAHADASTGGDAEPVVRVGLSLSSLHRALCSASSGHPAVQAVAYALIKPPDATLVRIDTGRVER